MTPMFNAWDNAHHVMYTHIEDLDGRNCMGSFSDFLNGLYTVLMCTGVKDTHRVFIYDMDVLEDKKGNRWLVQWDNRKARFYLEGKDRREDNWAEHSNSYEIIGCAMEKPDLF